jgi:hypothetical protein
MEESMAEMPNPNFAAADAPPADDRLHEACGVFGVYAPHEDVARVT